MDGISTQTIMIWLGVINLLVATLGVFLGYLFRSVQKNRADLMDFKVDVAQNWVHKNEMDGVYARIDALGERVEKRLDRFEDKIISNRKEVTS